MQLYICKESLTRLVNPLKWTVGPMECAPHSRQHRIPTLALVAVTLVIFILPRAALAQEFKDLLDTVELNNGSKINGKILGRIPVAPGDDVSLAVTKNGKINQIPYPRIRVKAIIYRGDKQLNKVKREFRANQIELAYQSLQQLDRTLADWRAKDLIRLNLGLAWGQLLLNNNRPDRAANIFRDAKKWFPASLDLKSQLKLSVGLVTEGAYRKRDYAAFRRLVNELQTIDPRSKKAKELLGLFEADFLKFQSDAQTADRAGDPRVALERYEEAYRMRPENKGLRTHVLRLRKIYQRFHYGEPTRILGFDPVTCLSPAERRMQQFLYSGIVRHIRDPRALVETSYTLDLARSVRPSPDGRKIYINLRPDLRWSDGSALSAVDVIATIQAMVAAKTDNRDAVFARLVDLKKTRVRSPTSLVIALNFSTPRPRMILDFPVLPKKLLGEPPQLKRGSVLSRQPVGSGPFRFGKRSGNEVIMLSNEHFVAARATLENKSILSEVRQTSFADATTARTRLENGQLDLLTNLHPADVIRLGANAQFQVQHFPMNQVTFIALNHRRKTLAGSKGFYIRKAINLAIDREKLLVEHYQARRGTKSAHRLISAPFPKGSWAYNEEIVGYQFNAALAHQTFRQSRINDLTLRFIHPPDPVITAVCSVMKKQIQDAGRDMNLKVRLVKLTPALFRKAIEKRSFDLAYCQYTFDRPIMDLEPLLADQETGLGGRNYMGYRDPELAKLFDLLRLTDLWTKIRALNHEIHRHLHENAVLVPLWQLDSYYAYSGRVKNLEMHPVHLFGSPWKLRLR
jgi:ABC-type oligopeptide transport system substrate-binding subunit